MKNGLYIWCVDKYAKEHMYLCKRAQLYQLIMEDPEGFVLQTKDLECIPSTYSKGKDDVTKDSHISVISIYVLIGTSDTQTMRLLGRTKKSKGTHFDRYNSTHNFVDQALVKWLGFSSHYIPSIKVSVANGTI